MQTKKKRLSILCGATLSLAFAALAVSMITNASSFLNTKANGIYAVNFGASNGQATVATKKTTISGAKTASNNDVNVEYKNMTPVSGKIGKLNASVNGFKAYYGNATPINGISSITVVSNASAGDAVVKYGRTSACIDGEFDLASGSVDGIYAHYFKIVADKEVTIDSVGIDLACDNTDNGFEASYVSSITSEFSYEYQESTDTYDLKRNQTGSVKKISVPDFYVGNEGFKYVTRLSGKQGYNGSYGFLEGANSYLEEVVMPETITGFGNWFFSSSSYDKLTTLSIPRELSAIGGTSAYVIPKSTSLTTVYYNAKNLSYTDSKGFSSSNQTALESVYVSYDVESLPNAFVTSFRDGVTLYYEGTEAEWAALTTNASKWNTASTVICSDTVLADVTFSFAGATLGTFEDSKTINTKVGASLANPGTPVNSDTTKKFDGWYTEPDGAGLKVSFPYSVTETTTIYANFIDMPAGYSLDNPVDAILDHTYSFATDSTSRFAYVRYTAASDIVVMATATNWSSTGTCTFKVYDADGTEVSISSGNGADTDVKVGPTAPSLYGVNVPVKIRMSAGDAYTFRFGTSSYDASFDVTVREPGANEDFTTATAIDEFGTEFEYTVNNYGVRWAYVNLTPGDYVFNAKANSWAGLYVGTISGNTWTNLTGSNFNAPGSGKDVMLSVTTAGRFYIPMTANSNGNVVTLKIYSEVPETYSRSSAKEITVGGDSVTASYTAEIQPKWFKFTAASAGRYIISSNKTLTVATGTNSWKSTTRYIGVYSYVGDEETKETITKNGTSEVYADLAAGVYYIKAATYSGASYDYTLAVSMISQVTLTYDTHGGSAIAPEEAYSGFAITKPADPTKANYRFDGWYTSDQYTTVFSFDNGITENTTIHAKWVRQYTVTIHANNGTEATTDLADENVPYVPETPVYEFHGFLGWYYDEDLETPFNPEAVVTGDFDIYADWKVQHYSNAAASFIEEVANSADYLYAYDDTPAGIVSTGTYQFTTFASSEYSGSLPGIKSTNKGINSSECSITLNFENAGLFSFNYAVSSEGANWDYFQVAVNGEEKLKKGGTTLINTTSGDIRVEKGQSLTMLYKKDSSSHGGIDEVYIWNMAFKPAPVILTSISLDTSNVKTSFELNEEFTYEGLVVTAYYSDDSSKTVAPTSVSTPDMTSDAKRTVTVTYVEDEIEKTAQYTIVVGNPPRYSNSAALYVDSLGADFLDEPEDGGITFGSYNFIRTVDGDPVDGIKSNNKNSSNTTAVMTLKFKTACIFTFSFKIESESGYDKGYVLKNVSYIPLPEGSGKSFPVSGDVVLENVTVTVAAGDTISFKYEKDSYSDTGLDTFFIYGISFVAIA